MLIGVQNRFVFVASPRAASASIEAALMSEAEIQRGESNSRRHQPLRGSLREYKFLFGRNKFSPDTFFKFGVMRDPIDWLQSAYRFRKGNVRRPLEDGTGFAAFFQRRVARTEKTGKKRLQRDYFTKADGTLLVDYLIPYDALTEHFATITSGLEFQDIALPHQNASTMTEMDEAPSAELLDEIRAYYAEDYELYQRIAEINADGLTHLENTRPQVDEEAATEELMVAD
jgi:hypothetical protein